MATGKGVRRSRETTLVRRSTTSSVSMRMLIRATALPCLTATLRGSNSDQAHPSPFSYKKFRSIVAFVPFPGGFSRGRRCCVRLLAGYQEDHAEAGSAPRAVLDPGPSAVEFGTAGDGPQANAGSAPAALTGPEQLEDAP